MNIQLSIDEILLLFVMNLSSIEEEVKRDAPNQYLLEKYGSISDKLGRALITEVLEKESKQHRGCV